MKTAAYFISGHGFGHGVRSCRIINSLEDELRPVIFSSLPEWFLDEELNTNYVFVPCELDCGCVQKNSVQVDISATLSRYAEINSSRELLIEKTSRQLRDYEAEFIMADIPPLAFAAAEKAGIPGYGISNFNWVDIYEPYLSEYPEYSDLLAQMKKDYSLCDKYFSLYPGLEGRGFKNIEKTGMVVRQGKNKRKAIAKEYNLDLSKKWCLIYLGNAGLENVQWSKLQNFSKWEFMGLYPLNGAPENYRHIKNLVCDYADFTASCDLILGKLGYGLVTESLRHGVPVLFIERQDFAEFKVFRQELLLRNQGIEINLPELTEMQILPQMKDLVSRKFEPVFADGEHFILKSLDFHTNP